MNCYEIFSKVYILRQILIFINRLSVNYLKQASSIFCSVTAMCSSQILAVV